MKATKISAKRLLLEFPTRKEMTLTNFRISEFKEGPAAIKDRYFTPDEFIDAVSDKDGNLKYFSYWEGFNYSRKELDDFMLAFSGCIGMISHREHDVLAKVLEHEIPYDGGYIISMVEGDTMTLRHETAHGLYFENLEYKSKAIDIVNSIEYAVYKRFQGHLVEMMYNEECLHDEMHAYLVAYDQEEWDECFPSIKLEEVFIQRNQLNALFDSYNK